MDMIHYVGMDVHKETIDLVVYRGNEQEVFLALKILLFIFICYAIIVSYKHNIYNTPRLKQYEYKCNGNRWCPVGSAVRIPLKEDRRVFTPLARSSYR